MFPWYGAEEVREIIPAGLHSCSTSAYRYMATGASRNVGLTFAYRICDGIATGIWSSALLSTYIAVLMGSNDSANEVCLSLLLNLA